MDRCAEMNDDRGQPKVAAMDDERCSLKKSSSCGRLAVAADRTVEDIRGYCRQWNMPSDVYRPVAGTRKFRLADLIAELYRVFDEDRVNVEYVRYLMESYQSDPGEWLKYAKFNKFRYTRNLVDAGNGKFNLMVLCWGEGNGSSIHDHPNSDCFMKILAGQLSEVRFAWPKDTGADADDQYVSACDDLKPLMEFSRTCLETNSVCHINGEYDYFC